ncbi:MAG TPA: metallophosphoesterase [Armatimonadota bacterium]|nr:metallophosphoesterase [Armatimonadota bacterium]
MTEHPTPSKAVTEPGELFFLVVNDIHYRDARCGPWLESAVGQMATHPERPEVCLFLGDLADEGEREQLEAGRRILDKLGLPVYPVIGNHDYAPNDDRTAYEALFPNRLNYHFEHLGWQFVGIDTTDGTRYEDIAIPTETLRWLDEVLPRLDPERPTVVFTHFPLGPGVRHRPRNADEILKRLEGRNIVAIFGGHFHGFTERHVSGMTLTTNSCLSHSRHNHDETIDKGYVLCHAKDGRVHRIRVTVPTAAEPPSDGRYGDAAANGEDVGRQ